MDDRDARAGRRPVAGPGVVLLLGASGLLGPAPPVSLGVGNAVGPALLHAQSVTERTPNLDGGWVGGTGVLHAHVVHRFWRVGQGTDDKLVNSPTMLLGLPLPGRVLVAGSFASNSLVSRDRFNEWEARVRWTPLSGRVEAGLTGAWNTAAGAADGEIALAGRISLPPGSPAGALLLLGSVRAHGAEAGGGAPGGEASDDPAATGWSAALGSVVRFGDGASLALDAGPTRLAGKARGRSWGAGLQLRIPGTPHTLSLQATNTRTATLRGSASPGRTVWGFEFTVPLVPARYLPRRGGSGASPPGTGPSGSPALVQMEALAFAPDTLRIRAGTGVTWENGSVLPHTVTADPERVPDPEHVSIPAGATPFDSGDLAPGGRFHRVFQVPGIYRYTCIPHGPAGMHGVIIVEP